MISTSTVKRLFAYRDDARKFVECRRCGQTVGDHEAPCPSCGSTSIATYCLD